MLSRSQYQNNTNSGTKNRWYDVQSDFGLIGINDPSQRHATHLLQISLPAQGRLAFPAYRDGELPVLQLC